MLTLAAGGSSAMMAGCLGDDDEEVPDDGGLDDAVGGDDDDDDSDPGTTDDDDDDTGVDDDGDPITTSITQMVGHDMVPGEADVNPLTPTGSTLFWMDGHCWRTPLGYQTYEGEVALVLLDDVRVEGDGCTVYWDFKEGFTWWDGTPVTAHDQHDAFLFDAYQLQGGPENIDIEYAVEDDYTLRIERDSPISQAAAELDAVAGLGGKSDNLRPWIEEYEAAADQEEIDEITAEIDEINVSLQEYVDQGLGCGLWKPDEWDTTRIVNTKYEDHPRADWTNLEEYVWRLEPDRQKQIQGINAGEFDIGGDFRPQVEQTNHLEQYMGFPSTGVMTLQLNFGNKHLADRAVRRAIALALDLEQIGNVVGEAHGEDYDTPQQNTGMNNAMTNFWLGEDFADELIDYDTSGNTERATEVLENAGYTHDGDYWNGPDGDRVEFSYLSPPWGSYETSATFIGSVLDDFGFDTTVEIPSSNEFWNRINETYDFDLVNWFHNALHPKDHYGINSSAGLDNYDDQIDEDATSTPDGCTVAQDPPVLEGEYSARYNHPIRPEFPTEVGTWDLENPQTLYPILWNWQMEQSQDEDQVRDLARKLAWYYNWQVPKIEIWEGSWFFWGDTDTYRIPNEDNPGWAENGNELGIDLIAYHMRGHISSRTE